MAVEIEEQQTFLMDDNTKELFELFPALNKGDLVSVEPYGELKEIVVLAALGNGLKNHGIEFVWEEVKGKKPEIKTSLVNGKIVVRADKALLDQIEAEVMKQISPELLAQAEKPQVYITNKLKEISGGSTPIKGSTEVVAAFAEAYRLYRQR